MMTREEWYAHTIGHSPDVAEWELSNIGAVIDRAIEEMCEKTESLKTAAIDSEQKPAAEEETVWASKRVDGYGPGGKNYLMLFDKPPEGWIDEGWVFECHVLPSDNLEPVAVREARKLREELNQADFDMKELRAEVKRQDALVLHWEELACQYHTQRDKAMAEQDRLNKQCSDGRAELKRISEERDAMRVFDPEEYVAARVRSLKGHVERAEKERDELQSKHDKLLLLASKVRTAWIGHGSRQVGQNLRSALGCMDTHIGESDPKEKGVGDEDN